jgi:hypothetical protein
MSHQSPTQPSTELAPPRQAPRKKTLLSAIARILGASKAAEAERPQKAQRQQKAPRPQSIEWALRMMD